MEDDAVGLLQGSDHGGSWNRRETSLSHPDLFLNDADLALAGTLDLRHVSGFRSQPLLRIGVARINGSAADIHTSCSAWAGRNLRRGIRSHIRCLGSQDRGGLTYEPAQSLHLPLLDFATWLGRHGKDEPLPPAIEKYP